MIKRTRLSKGLLLSGVLLSLSTAYAGEDLGSISVESSTISNLTVDKKTEVSSVDIIDEETIDTVDAKNLTDLLKTIPGVTSLSRAGEMMQIKFRGVGQQQYMGENPGVAIIVDGVPVMAKSGGIRLNLTDIESIKVVKGSASYLYGDGALSGALIITTKKAKGKSESELRATLGSYNYLEYIASTTQSNEYFAINLNASKRSTDGYWTDSEMWTKSLNGKLSYYIDDTSDVTLGVDVTKKFDEGGSRSVVAGVTEAEDNPKGPPNTAYSKDSGVDLNKYFLTYTKDFGKNSLVATIYQYEDLYNQTSNPQDLDGDPTTPNVYVNQSSEELTQRGLKAEYRMEFDAVGSLIGLELGHRDYENYSKTLADYTDTNSRTGKEENYYKGETSQTNSKEDIQALYAEVKYAITSELTTTLNARYNIQKKEYDKNSYDYNGTTWQNVSDTQSHTFRNTAYRLGLTYNINPYTSLFSSVSTGFLNPEVSDWINNPDLKEQTSINYEIGARGYQPVLDNSLNYQLSIFQLDNRDIIGPLDGTYAFMSPYDDNIGDSRSRGLELSLSSDREKTVSFSLAYTYLDAKYTKHNPFLVDLGSRGADYYIDLVGNDLPRTSKHTVDMFVYYKPMHDLKFIAEGYSKSDYYADEGNKVKFDGYALLNLQARYTTKLFGGSIECFVMIDNVFDNQYYRSALIHSDKRGAPDGSKDDRLTQEDASITVDPGRVYYAGLSYKF
jgi:iron complex outermembrane receptor protein